MVLILPVNVMDRSSLILYVNGEKVCLLIFARNTILRVTIA